MPPSRIIPWHPWGRIRPCLVWVCLFGFLQALGYGYPVPPGKAQGATDPVLTETLSRLMFARQNAPLELEIHGDSIQFSEVLALLQLFLPSTVLSWKWEGSAAFDLLVSSKSTQQSGYRELDLAIRVRNGAFANPGETKAGDHIQGMLHFQMDIPVEESRTIGFRGELSLQAGEVLLDRFYFNLKEDPFRLEFHGTYDPNRHRLAPLSVNFSGPAVQKGSITGVINGFPSNPQGEVEILIGPISNPRAFGLFVREPFGSISPMLKDAELTGETVLTGFVRGSFRRFSMEGQIEMSPSDLTTASHQLEINGLKVRFPFSLDSSPGSGEILPRLGLNNPRKGIVQADRVQWGSQEWKNVTLPFAFEEDSLILPDRIRVPIWGGAVTLSNCKVRSPLKGKREITLSAKVDRIDFSEMIKPLAPLPLPGILEGDFPMVNVSAETLSTKGSLNLYAFGGQFEVSKIHGTDVFSRLRDLTMDVRISSINLEEASRLVKFGQMGGIVQGYIRDLAFSFGQPERFELAVENVKQRGIRQYVNAEAVNNLSILGSGSPFSLGGMTRMFVRSYPYDKLGIYCKLENDVFTLRGTIHEKGIEYLIKRGTFGGIDVINQNPNNQIRWKQMIQRFETIGKNAGAMGVATQ